MSKLKKFIYVLGISQDGGYPHLGCDKECCLSGWNDSSLSMYPSCIAYVIDKLQINILIF